MPPLHFVFLHWEVMQWLPSSDLKRVLDRAIELGLVSKRHRRDHSTGASEESDYEFKITDRFLSIKELMGLSTAELSERTEQSIQVEPIFDSPTSLSTDVFVIVPFASDYVPIFKVIEKTATKHGFLATKADQFLKSDHIVTDIWSLLHNSNLVICDCTALNPNVMYELGIAHALGKHTVLITQDPNSVPFDLKHMRYLTYGNNPLADEEFISKLDQVMEGVRSKIARSDVEVLKQSRPVSYTVTSTDESSSSPRHP